MKDTQIYYEPYVFTLEREIKARKAKGTLFREQELWKLLGYLCRGALEWRSVYPNDILGLICPSNILLNPEGQVRLVSKLSFLNNSCMLAGDYLVPPERQQRGSEFIIFNDGVSVYEASMVYSMGIVLMEAAIREVFQPSERGTEEGMEMFRGSGYSSQLKVMVARMTAERYYERPLLRELLETVKEVKGKYM